MSMNETTPSKEELQAQLDIVDSNLQKLVGALVALRRIEKQLTHDDLIVNASISRPTLSKLEGGAKVSKRLLGKVFDALDISSEEVQKLEEAAKYIDPDMGLDALLPGNEALKNIFRTAVSAMVSQSNNIKPHTFSRMACVTAILSDYPMARP